MRTVSRLASCRHLRYSTQSLLEALEPRQLFSAGFTPEPLYPNDQGLVNTSNGDAGPAAASFADGSYIVAWSGSLPNASGPLSQSSDIFAQLYAADGTKIGPQIRVNASVRGNQTSPAITILQDQSVVIVWATDSGQSGILGQRFSPDVTPLGREFPVSTDMLPQHKTPAITSLATGGFAVTWAAGWLPGSTGPGSDIFARVFSAHAAPSGTEFLVNTDGSRTAQTDPAICRSGNGFLIAWSSKSGLTTHLAAQAFDQAGHPVGTQSAIGYGADATKPALAQLASGCVVVAWEYRSAKGFALEPDDYWNAPLPVITRQGADTLSISNPDATIAPLTPDSVIGPTPDLSIIRLYNAYDVVVNLLTVTSDGIYPSSDPVTIPKSSYDRYRSPSIAPLSDGGFVVTLNTGLAGDHDIVAQRMDYAAQPLGNAFLVNRTTLGNQQDSTVVQTSNGSFVAIWNDIPSFYPLEGSLSSQHFDFTPSIKFPLPGLSSDAVPYPPDATIYLPEELNSPIVDPITQNDLRYTDRYGNSVRITLTGPGTLNVLFDGLGLSNVNAQSIKALGTLAGRSSLTITVGKSHGPSTGFTSVDEILIEGGLTGFNASKVNVTGSLTVNGNINSVSLNDLVGQDQRRVTINNTGANRTSFTFGRIQDTIISVSAGISRFSALDWTDSDAQIAPDMLTSVSLGSITIQGNFQPDWYVHPDPYYLSLAPVVTGISISGQSTGNWWLQTKGIESINIGQGAQGLWEIWGNAGSVNVAGQVLGLAFHVGGNLASLTLKDRAEASIFTVYGNVNAVSIGESHGNTFTFNKNVGLIQVKAGVTGSNLYVGDSLGTLVAQKWSNGNIHAHTIGLVNIQGNLENSLISFGSRDPVTTRPAWINRISIAGHASNIEISGPGALNQFHALGAENINITVDAISTFTSTGPVENLSLQAKNINAINTGQWVGGKVQATRIGSITTRNTGQTAGDLTIELNADNPGRTAIGSIQVAGMLHSKISARGNVGSVSAGAMNQNLLYISDGSLNSLRIKGNATRSYVTVQATLNVFSAGNWIEGYIDVGDINSFTTTAGFYNATLSVNNIDSRKLSLRSANIRGPLSGSLVRVPGNAGSIMVGSIENSSVLIGVKTELEPQTLPHSNNQFYRFDAAMLRYASLNSFTVTGKNVDAQAPSFINSVIAAGYIGNVMLKNVQNNPDDALNGVAAIQIGNYSRNGARTGPKTVPGLYDPINLTGESGFVLKIVP